MSHVTYTREYLGWGMQVQVMVAPQLTAAKLALMRQCAVRHTAHLLLAPISA